MQTGVEVGQVQTRLYLHLMETITSQCQHHPELISVDIQNILFIHPSRRTMVLFVIGLA